MAAGAEYPSVSTYSFSKPLSSKFRLLVFLIHEGQGRTPLLIHKGPLRGTKNGNGNTFVRGGHGGPRRTATAELQQQLLFVHEGPRRTAKYTSIYPRRSRRTTKNGNGNTFVRGGRGGPRRTAFVVAADRGRRARESGGRRPDSARGRVKERRGEEREHLCLAHSGSRIEWGWVVIWGLGMSGFDLRPGSGIPGPDTA